MVLFRGEYNVILSTPIHFFMSSVRDLILPGWISSIIMMSLTGHFLQSHSLSCQGQNIYRKREQPILPKSYKDDIEVLFLDH